MSASMLSTFKSRALHFLVVYVAGGRRIVISEEDLMIVLREISALKTILAECIDLLRSKRKQSSLDSRGA